MMSRENMLPSGLCPILSLRPLPSPHPSLPLPQPKGHTQPPWGLRGPSPRKRFLPAQASRATASVSCSNGAPAPSPSTLSSRRLGADTHDLCGLLTTPRSKPGLPPQTDSPPGPRSLRGRPCLAPLPQAQLLSAPSPRLGHSAVLGSPSSSGNFLFMDLLIKSYHY